ncbi:hypothetical protein Naga_100158g6 [Nannochloropsis gaditana]|uniref:F-box domain-containing protein n=1 Tax=Nannochloropsis gaditana TaxID=72520 RepID=W7TRV9_9STRA|nr:hypothetical protein Naga_100158g6 [Nannochloropsis gaditana]
MMSRVREVEKLKRSMLVRARLLQWRLLSRRRPPARWFVGANTRDNATSAGGSRVLPGNAESAALIDSYYPVSSQNGAACHHRQTKIPFFLPPQHPASYLSEIAVACPELLEQIFHYVRSRELRAVTVVGRPFKYELDCQEIWRSLYFLRFAAAFGKFKNWKNCYILRDERCDRIRTWRKFFEASRVRAVPVV